MTKTLLALIAASAIATPALAALPVGAPAPEIAAKAYLWNGEASPFSLNPGAEEGAGGALYFFPSRLHRAWLQHRGQFEFADKPSASSKPRAPA